MRVTSVQRAPLPKESREGRELTISKYTSGEERVSSEEGWSHLREETEVEETGAT